MTTHAEFLQRLSRKYPAPSGDRILSDGGPNARVMIVGGSMTPGETKPFSGPIGSCVRGLLAKMRVGFELVLLTNLIKVPGDSITSLGCWVTALFEEIEIVQPKAVILMGLPVARAVLKVTQENINDVRMCRYVWPGRTDAIFFATHAVEDLKFPNGGLNLESIAWINDTKAVFEADDLYYEQVRVVKG